MCIRDREKTAYETVEIKGIYDIKNISDNAFNPTAKKAENLIFSDSQLSVSYTHLDVYKRQGQGGAVSRGFYR